MANFYLWGVIASPYQLKMQALLDYAEHSWSRCPAQSGRLSNMALMLKLQHAKRMKKVQRFTGFTPELDEYPSVPFYTLDKKTFYYDSSSLAYHLDQHPQCHEAPLIPEDPLLAFICTLIDEAFDEFGLYMVHHNRWVVSAQTNLMGVTTAEEFSHLLPAFIASKMSEKLPKRQVRRCPYLFSVAPAGFDAGVEPELTAPGKDGFPPTHDLLNQAWRKYLAALEQVLAKQPYLLGDRFTLADASAYGQLSMNFIDGVANDLLAQLAPVSHNWLRSIERGEHKGVRGALYLSDELQGLLTVIDETFVSLMLQNSAAHTAAVADGETLYNEKAFDRGRSLYAGQLMGQGFKAAVKTFQVKVWKDLQNSWAKLHASDRKTLGSQLPEKTVSALSVSSL